MEVKLGLGSEKSGSNGKLHIQSPVDLPVYSGNEKSYNTARA